MKYTIISINDDRRSYKDNLRGLMPFEEIEMPAFDAHEDDPLAGIKDRGLDIKSWPNAKRGELGVWLSNYDRWAYTDMLAEPLIVFEDDAIIDTDFEFCFDKLFDELPADWDFCSLWVPENQQQDYLYRYIYNSMDNSAQFLGFATPENSIYRIAGKEYVALAYQGYGMVALMYSPNGGRKLVDMAHQHGMTGPVDCWIYEQAKLGRINGYAPRPEHTDIVQYDWAAESHVQQTDRI